MSGVVMGRRPGKPVILGDFGGDFRRERSQWHRKMSVYGRPVTEGVEDARGLASVSKN